MSGPWFVACVESEAEFQVFGPLWEYEHAEREAAADYGFNPCANRHLIGQRLGDGVIPRYPSYYTSSVELFVFGDRSLDWLKERGWTNRQREEAGSAVAF